MTTLSEALRYALDPANHAGNLNPILREIVAHRVTSPKHARRGLVSRVLFFGLAPLGEGAALAQELPEIVAVLVNAGSDQQDLRLVIEEPVVAPEMPRSAEWCEAAERLATWADTRAGLEESP